VKTTDLLPPAVRGAFGGQLEALPRFCFYEPSAAGRLAAALGGETDSRHALLFFDARTRPLAGEPCMDALRSAGWEFSACLIADGEDGTSPVCDDRTFRGLQGRLEPAGVYVAAGSGVVNDLTKWLAAEAGRPYAVLATAASMNGYTAANVAPAIEGVKSLFRARGPRLVAADPGVIAGAPAALTAAGLGDVIAKPVSTADWLMNHVLFGESFSEPIAGIANAVEPLYLDNPEGVARRDPAAIEGLYRALILSGCAMTLQGSSLPASGGEHLVSHTLDMKAHVDRRPHDLHGRQVGVATIFAAALYRRILAVEAPAFRAAFPEFDAAWWGGLAGAVRREHDKAAVRAAAAAAALSRPGQWDAVRTRLAPVLRDPAAIKDCLRRAGAAHRPEDIGISMQAFCAAVRHAVSIRERFTSLSLGLVTGVLPGAIEDIAEEWLG